MQISHLNRFYLREIQTQGNCEILGVEENSYNVVGGWILFLKKIIICSSHYITSPLETDSKGKSESERMISRRVCWLKDCWSLLYCNLSWHCWQDPSRKTRNGWNHIVHVIRHAHNVKTCCAYTTRQTHVHKQTSGTEDKRATSHAKSSSSWHGRFLSKTCQHGLLKIITHCIM